MTLNMYSMSIILQYSRKDGGIGGINSSDTTCPFMVKGPLFLFITIRQFSVLVLLGAWNLNLCKVRNGTKNNYFNLPGTTNPYRNASPTCSNLVSIFVTLTLFEEFTKSIAVFIVCPGTYPAEGTLTRTFIEPLSIQKKEQKFLLTSSSTANCTSTIYVSFKFWTTTYQNLEGKRSLTHFCWWAFRSRIERTVKAVLHSWSNLHGRSITHFTVYLTCP